MYKVSLCEDFYFPLDYAEHIQHFRKGVDDDVAFACEPCALGDLCQQTLTPSSVVSVFVMEIIALICVESHRWNFVHQSTALPASGV